MPLSATLRGRVGGTSVAGYHLWLQEMRLRALLVQNLQPVAEEQCGLFVVLSVFPGPADIFPRGRTILFGYEGKITFKFRDQGLGNQLSVAYLIFL